MSNKSCKPCDPGYNVLFGVGRESETSHTFSVGDRPLVLRACGLPDDACVTITQTIEVCGEMTSCTAVDLNGCPVTLCAASPMAILAIPGNYYAQLEGAEPDDVTLTIAELPSNITYTANGGGGMGCGPNIVVSSDADSITVVLDGEVHRLQLDPSTMTLNPDGSYTHTAGGASTVIPAAVVPTLGVESNPDGSDTYTWTAPDGSTTVFTNYGPTDLSDYLQNVATDATITGDGTPGNPLSAVVPPPPDLTPYMTVADHDASLVPVYSNDGVTVLFNAHAV